MTAREVAKAKIANSRPYQTLHAITHRFEHAPDLSIDSLAQYNSQTRRRARAQMCNARAFAVEQDSTEQFRREGCIPGAIQSYLILLVDLVARMREALGKIAVVCQNQEAFALRIESTDIEQAREFRRQQIKNRVAGARIFSCRNKTSRLVQNNVQRPFRAHELAVHFDVVALARLRAEIRARLSVNRDASGRDQFVAMPARADSGGGKKSVQTQGKLSG